MPPFIELTKEKGPLVLCGRHTYQTIILLLKWLYRCFLFSLHLTERFMLDRHRFQVFLWKAKYFFTFAKQLMLKDTFSSLCFQKFPSWKQDFKKQVETAALSSGEMCVWEGHWDSSQVSPGVLWPDKILVIVLCRRVLCCTELYFFFFR